MVMNINEAIQTLTQKLIDRGTTVISVEDLSKNGKYGNARLTTDSHEIYHVKYTKSGYKPKDSDRVSSGAKELDAKLKFAIKSFGNGEDTLNGIDEDLILYLLSMMNNGFVCFFVTVLSDGTTLWCRADSFYEFVMRYDTFFKFPKTNVPVCEVPMGWLKPWGEPIVGYPSKEI